MTAALDNLRAPSTPQTGKLSEAHDRLASHYARLTEGLDHGPAREAKAVLDELAETLETETTASQPRCPCCC